MDINIETDAVTAAACRWLLEGGEAGAYRGPDPGDRHDLTPLLSRETGRRETALLSQAGWVRMEEAVKPVLRRLNNAGVPVLAFKGFDLAMSLYPFRGARPMGDVDLFMRLEDRAAVLDSFIDCGWSVGSPGRSVFASGIVSEIKLIRQGILVELHSHIFYFPATFPGVLPDDLFSGCREPAPGIMAFSWHDSLLMVALHMLTNSSLRPVWWVDVCLLCRKVTESGSWKKFTMNACRTGLGPSIASLLKTASSFPGAEVPKRVTDLLERGRSTGESVLAGLRTGRKIPTLMNLRYLTGWKRISWSYCLLWMLVSRRRPVTWEDFTGR